MIETRDARRWEKHTKREYLRPTEPVVLRLPAASGTANAKARLCRALNENFLSWLRSEVAASRASQLKAARAEKRAATEATRARAAAEQGAAARAAGGASGRGAGVMMGGMGGEAGMDGDVESGPVRVQFFFNDLVDLMNGEAVRVALEPAPV